MDAMWGAGPQLWPGEHVLWQGAPDGRRVLGRGDAVPLLLLVPWSAFAVFWELQAVREGPPFFVVWGAMIFVLGLGSTVVPLLARLRTRRRTTYVLTDLRAIITTGDSSRDIPLAGQQVAVTRSRDGRRATVTVGPDWGGDRWYDRYYGVGRRRPGPVAFRFEEVPDPDPLLAALTRPGNRFPAPGRS